MVGIDAVVGGAGTDTFVQTVGDSAAATATNLAADTLTANCTITGNGVDLLTTFTTTTDKIDLVLASATPLQATNNVNSLTIGNNYIIRGAIVTNTGVFTQADDGDDHLLFTAAGTTLNGQASTGAQTRLLAMLLLLQLETSLIFFDLVSNLIIITPLS